MQFVTPQKDIDWALSVEKSLQDHEKEFYNELMNNVSMSERIKTPDADGRNVRDGCILTGLYCRCKDERNKT
jgi:hypothetical protein